MYSDLTDDSRHRGLWRTVNTARLILRVQLVYLGLQWPDYVLIDDVRQFKVLPAVYYILQRKESYDVEILGIQSIIQWKGLVSLWFPYLNGDSWNPDRRCKMTSRSFCLTFLLFPYNTIGNLFTGYVDWNPVNELRRRLRHCYYAVIYRQYLCQSLTPANHFLFRSVLMSVKNITWLSNFSVVFIATFIK